MQIDYTSDTITPDVTTVLAVGGTGGLVLSTGSTVQRPTATNGTIRYNTDLDRVEAVIDGAWSGLADGGTQGNAVRVATTVNLTLTAPGATIDGVAMVAGDRVLVKDQTTVAQNGIYIWNGAAVAMTRAPDMQANWNGSVPGRLTFVNEGNSSQFFNFRFVTAFNGTYDTTAIPVTTGWQQAGRITFGNNATPVRAATGGTVTPVYFQMIEPTAMGRLWKFAAQGATVNTGFEFAIGTNDDVANAANAWWNIVLSSDTQEGIQMARKTGGINEPHFFLDGSGRLTIGTSVLASGTTGAALASTAGVGLYVNTTDAVQLPVGTSAQRPTGSQGMVRFNSTIGFLEQFNDGNWTPMAMSGTRGMGTIWNDFIGLYTNTTTPTILIGAEVGVAGSGTASGIGVPATVFANATDRAIGVAAITTGSTTTGRVSVGGEAASTLFGLGFNFVEWRVRIEDLSVLNQDYVLEIGYFNHQQALVANNATLPTSCACFTYHRTTNANWQLRTANNGTATTTTTSSVVTADVWQKFGVMDDGTTTTYLIDDVVVGTSTTNRPVGTTSQVGYGLKLAKTSGTTPRIVYVDYVYSYYTINTPR